MILCHTVRNKVRNKVIFNSPRHTVNSFLYSFPELVIFLLQASTVNYQRVGHNLSCENWALQFSSCIFNTRLVFSIIAIDKQVGIWVGNELTNAEMCVDGCVTSRADSNLHILDFLTHENHRTRDLVIVPPCTTWETYSLFPSTQATKNCPYGVGYDAEPKGRSMDATGWGWHCVKRANTALQSSVNTDTFCSETGW